MTSEDFAITTDDILLRRELIAQGWTDRDIAGQVRAGLLTKVRYGAYIMRELVDSLDEAATARVRARAVLRTAHPTSVLSGHTALNEYGVDLWGVNLDETHLTRRDGKAGRRQSGVVHHCAALPVEQTLLGDGVPLVTPARAALEVMAQHRTEVALVLVSGLLHRRHTTLEEVNALYEATPYWPESLSSRIVLRLADHRHQSVAERRADYLFYKQSLPRPEPQVEVHDEWGQLVGIVDFLWREHGVFLEFDGRIKYQRYRRKDETLEEYLMREKKREERICQLTGWVCIRITWEDLGRPVETARRIRALLASRGTPAA
jgi:hypothetical protein